MLSTRADARARRTRVHARHVFGGLLNAAVIVALFLGAELAAGPVPAWLVVAAHTGAWLNLGIAALAFRRAGLPPPLPPDAAPLVRVLRRVVRPTPLPERVAWDRYGDRPALPDGSGAPCCPLGLLPRARERFPLAEDLAVYAFPPGAVTAFANWWDELTLAEARGAVARVIWPPPARPLRARLASAGAALRFAVLPWGG